MTRIKWEEKITVDPGLHHGEPCIAGTRIPVSTILGCLAEGMSLEEIQEEYPQLTDTDIRAALAYAADVLHDDILTPLTGAAS